jgi:glutathione S-transferase
LPAGAARRIIARMSRDGPVLFQLLYSPWSEKARWALDHHRLSYRRVEYLPMLGAPLLRARTRRLRGKVTVPALVDGPTVVFDSFEIARYAEERGSGAPLFVRGAEASAWNARAEALMHAGRARVTVRVGQSAAARRETLPPWARKTGPLATPLVRLGIGYLTRKYALDAASLSDHEATMRRELVALRHALAGGRTYLLGDAFSIADIAMAASLQFVQPVPDAYLRVGPATRDAWTEPDLSREFADLLRWRDRIYELHRTPRERP